MLKILTFIITLAISPFALAEAEIGQVAPDFSAVDTNGNDVQISALAGKLVVLEWTNDGCPFVQKHYGSGNMQALQKKFTAQDVVWLSIISSAEGKQGNVSAEEANELTTSRDAAPSSVILDPSGEIGHLYGAKSTPHIFIINKAGNIAYKGAIDDHPSADQADVADAKNYVSQALTELIAGEEISEPITKQYGCGIKY